MSWPLQKMWKIAKSRPLTWSQDQIAADLTFYAGQKHALGCSRYVLRAAHNCRWHLSESRKGRSQDHTWLRRSADLASTAWHIAFVDGLDGSSCVHEPELPADVQLRSSTAVVRSAPTAEVQVIQGQACW